MVVAAQEILMPSRILPPASLLVLASYVFLVISGLSTDFEWLARWRWETLHWGLAFMCGVALAYREGRMSVVSSREVSAFFAAMALAAGSLAWPAIVSATAPAPFSVVGEAPFRQFGKSILLLPFLWLAMRSVPQATKVLRLTVLAAAWVLLLHGLYRFYGLGDVNSESGRMMLQLRHGDPNFWALILLVGVMVHAREMLVGARSIAVRSLHVLAIAIFMGAIMLSASRTALLASFLCAGILAWRFLQPRVRWIAIVVMTAAVMATFFLAPATDEQGSLWRLAQLADESALGRVHSLQAGFSAFVDRPWAGFGMHEAAHVMHRYVDPPSFAEHSVPLTIHHSWLQVLAEQGLIGLGVFAGMMLLCWRRIEVLGQPSTWIFGALTMLIVLVGQQTLPIAYSDVFWLLLALAPAQGAA